MLKLVQFCQEKEVVWWHGALWAAGLAGSELLRVLTFGLTWGIAYRYLRFLLASFAHEMKINCFS